MNLTNQYGFPAAIANALQRVDEDYRGNPDPQHYSVTGLLNPPKITQLRRRFRDQTSADVSEQVWKLLGNATHYVIQKAATDAQLFERRLSVQLPGGIVISGQPDLLETDGWLNDYKVTSVWSFLLDDKPEWEWQLNLYALLARLNGYTVTGLRIVGILRDWSKSELRRDPARYPDVPLKMKVLPLWTQEEQIQFLKSRLALHLAAASIEDPDGIAECTPEERWQKPDQWAVYKGPNKRAARVLETEPDAYDWIRLQNPKDSYRVQCRPSRATRCCDYCEVAPFCHYGRGLAASDETE